MGDTGSSSSHNQNPVRLLNRRKLPISMARKKKAKPDISRHLRGELQGLVAIKALDQLMKGSELKVAEQEKEHAKFFHGDNKILISHVSMLAKGEDEFADLFEPDPDNKHQRRIRKIFHPSEKSMILGKNIKQSDLEQATFESKELITGRQLRARAKTHLRFGKKALSELSKHVDLNTGKPRHSGHTVEDAAKSVLDAMWEMRFDLPEW